jgi:tripartite-type tricarboxylate transporter receptor subunit TctC
MLPFHTARRALLLALSCAAFAAPAAQAGEYPDHAVRVIVAYAPGGANDTIARLYAQGLSEELGQPFVVENHAGGSGIPGTSSVARATPDGYTLLLGAGGTMTINPSLFKKLPYDSVKSFAPVGLLARSPLVLVVPPSLPVHNVQELIAYAHKQPNGITFASPGAGTPLHLAGELFTRKADITTIHIPYKGSTPALTDLMAAREDMMFDVLGSSMGFVKSGRLRALAVSSTTRSPQLPDVPTVQEQGVKDFDVTSWFAYFAPAGTPQPVIDRLNAAIAKVAATPAIKTKLSSMGMEPATSTPAQLGAMVKEEKAKWAEVIKMAHVEAR